MRFDKFKSACDVILFCFLMLLSTNVIAQTGKVVRRTVSGYVTDAKSSETLLNASVYDAGTMTGAVTNNFGYYSLQLSEGSTTIKCSYVGYATFDTTMSITSDTILNIRLKPAADLAEVTIVADAIDNNVSSTRMSTIEIPVKQFKRIPAIFGETDIIKSLQLLPGVQSGTEGSAGMYVRGGGPDENLILLDGVPLYNVNHAMGFFSAFNDDAIKNVTLYKGNFPARFGGRLSSVVDVRTKDGNMQHYHGNISVGLIAAKVNVEGPIVKDKTSFNFSFRRTYYDILFAPVIKLISRNLSETQFDKLLTGYYFYDFNLKLNHKFSDKDRLFLSLYSGDDKVYAKIKINDESYYDGGEFNSHKEDLNVKWRWGNRIAALRWNHVVTPEMFMNLTATYTQYRHVMDIDYALASIHSAPNYTNNYSETIALNLNSGIYDGSIKVDFDYNPHENHDIKYGANVTLHSYNPSSVGLHLADDSNDDGGFVMDSVIGNNKMKALETDLYIEDNWKINRVLNINAGLHYTTFTVQKRTFHSFQPRLSMRALVTDDLSFKLGYAVMSQYVHLLSSNSISLPTDLWVPVTDRIMPMKAHQVAVGAFYNWKGFEFSIEGYYKYMKNVVEYKDGASFFTLDATDWQDKVVMGNGYSYGIEFFAQRSIGKVTGWIGYTWAHVYRLFDRQGQELNFGKPFPAKYDRRHDLNIVLSYKPNDRFDMGATWVFSSGNCATLAMQNYHGLPMDNIFATIGHIEYRNNYRFESYQRLDLGFNFHKQKKHGIRTWSLSIYNTLFHNNPYLVYVKQQHEWDNETNQYNAKNELTQVCIFPFIPSVSYSFKF